jgi:hypothetical protein
LTSLPFAALGFALSKQEFRDAIAIRFNLHVYGLPDRCACGDVFNINHSMQCKRQGYVTLRHNEIRDATVEMLKEVCSDVTSEPSLIPLTGENFTLRSANTSDEAKLDISARSFWIRGQRAFFDVRVFYPLAHSYRNQELHAIHRSHEMEKRRQYNQRVIQVEHGSFTPLVFTSLGGIDSNSECAKFYDRLAELLAAKRGDPKSIVSTWIRCRLSFSLLRSSLICLRGSRTRPFDPERVADTAIDVALENAQLQS